MQEERTRVHGLKVAELCVDLEKAAIHLQADARADVLLYSRADFGDLGRLVDRAMQMPELASFDADLPKTLVSELAALRAAWQPALDLGPGNAYDLLRRTTFQPTFGVDRLPDELRAELARVVTRTDDAYNALWQTLDSLGARIGANPLLANDGRLTRIDALHLKRGMRRRSMIPKRKFSPFAD